jgi:hypothetical protein
MGDRAGQRLGPIDMAGAGNHLHQVGFSDDEVERMRGAAVFTHNHPAGNSFSPQDVSLACTLQFHELRVVTSQWTFVLRPGPAGWSDNDGPRLDEAGQRAFLAVTDAFQEA